MVGESCLHYFENDLFSSSYLSHSSGCTDYSRTLKFLLFSFRTHSHLIFATTLWAPYIIAQGTNNTFSNLPNLYAIERVEQRYDPKRCDFSTHTINHEAVPPLQAALWENDSPVTCWREWLLKSTAVMSFYYWWHQRGSLVAQMVKNLSTMQETQVRSLGW